MSNQARHIQDYGSASSLEPHWGYADRVMPCTNDAGSCEYLDIVYHSHDLGMLYAGIFWCVVGGGLLLWALLRGFGSDRPGPRWWRATKAWTRRHLGKEAPLRTVFGNVTRVQVLFLVFLLGYLAVFSFVGIVYKTWMTPVKSVEGMKQKRSSMGPVADRLGVLAYALTPLSILLASRESLLSAVTGIPYHHFNFLHRWTGHIILFQAVWHTIFWCVIEIRYYQPQPTVAVEWITQPYMIWGIVAMILLLILWGLATPWARRAFGYEFFRKAHYVLAMLYIGACWAHWAQLKCFMLPALLFWFADRGARFARTALIHYQVLPGGHGVFTTLPARVTCFDDADASTALRLDVPLSLACTWDIGQHYYLTFAQGSIWQSHPFTPLSLPGGKEQSFLIRAKKGETQKIAKLCAAATATSSAAATTPVILTGPYGTNILPAPGPTPILAIAGGTGISFVLPVLLALIRRPAHTRGHLQLLWAVRYARDAEWVAPELAKLRAAGVHVVVHATREHVAEGSDSSDGGLAVDATECSTPGAEGEKIVVAVREQRPDVHAALARFLQRGSGEATVYVSGPPGMVSDTRAAVAEQNKPGEVWRGGEGEVRIVYDDRLE